MRIDIGTPPWEGLSNFHPYPFIFRDVHFASMEGFLQGLKFPIIAKQDRLSGMVGIKAKRLGQKKKWWLEQVLYWRGEPIDRHSEEYQLLITEAFYAMYSQNAEFRSLLAKTGQATLTHEIGRRDPFRTILTEQEFTGILTALRDKINS